MAKIYQVNAGIKKLVALRKAQTANEKIALFEELIVLCTDVYCDNYPFVYWLSRAACRDNVDIRLPFTGKVFARYHKMFGEKNLIVFTPGFKEEVSQYFPEYEKLTAIETMIESILEGISDE